MTQKGYDDGVEINILVTCDRCGAETWDPFDRPLTWHLNEAGPDFCPECTVAMGLAPCVNFAP